MKPSSCHSMAQNVTSTGVPHEPAISPPNVGTEVTVASGSVASTSGHVKLAGDVVELDGGEVRRDAGIDPYQRSRRVRPARHIVDAGHPVGAVEHGDGEGIEVGLQAEPLHRRSELFTLHDTPDYPATLDIEYPGELSRGLVLVKWWLLAIPQYLLVGIMVGGGSFAASRTDDWEWGGFGGGLVGLLVLFAGVALLFTGRYPGGIFDVVLGLDRWVARVVAYAGLMTDRYPPFRLDQGGTEPGGTPHPVVAVEPTSAAAPAAEGGRGGRIVLLVLGSIAALFAFAALAGGCALVAIDQTQRDDDGFLMSPSEELSTPTYAIVSESAELETSGAEWALDTFLGTVRIRSESERPVFVGIARRIDVERYLGSVERDAVSDFDGDPRYEPAPGEAPQGPPGEQTFWVASASGTGEQTLEWEPEDGFWQAVLMNEDGSRGVSSEVSIGAELDSVLWIGLALLVVGALLACGAALAVTAGIRRGRRPEPQEPQGST